ncbi:MAG: hypothetical protein HYZ81_19860, partial [Nitrospinae bacterium]|nr:hypothetical protein [Nitrospinota bacterium]
MFEGFERRQITTSGTTINLVKGGDGPPLLLLHDLDLILRHRAFGIIEVWRITWRFAAVPVAT